MSEKPVRRWQLMFDEFGDGEMVKHDKGLYVALEDYVALERRHQDLLDAIERTGGLDNIRRVEVSQPVVIDMARENAFLNGENARLKAEVERLTALVESNLNSSKVTMGKADAVLHERDSLKAEVERLRKAGDAVCESPYLLENDPAVIAWRAAKEGQPSV